MSQEEKLQGQTREKEEEEEQTIEDKDEEEDEDGGEDTNSALGSELSNTRERIMTNILAFLPSKLSKVAL